MRPRVTFADLLKVGAEKDKQRLNLQLAPPAPVPQSVAPEKDFNKRANSLERDALPKGLLPGASKAIYDALYLRTLGALDPVNVIQATRREIIEWSGVKNIKTVNAHLKKLEENGFIKRSNFNGEQSGSYYAICVPMQLEMTENTTENDPDQTRPRPDPDQTQTSTENWSGSGLGNPLENKGLSYVPLKTKKKKKNDDEPAALKNIREKNFFGEILGGRLDGVLEQVHRKTLSDANFGVLEKAVNEISKKLIGRELKLADNEKLKELSELLVMELEFAAARADSISNVPAFLTEHLRRRLSRKPDSTPEAKTSGVQRIESLPIGETGGIRADAEIYQAEPLTEQARETVLATMRQYVERGQREFVLSLENTYTAEDWQWLSENLSGEKAKK